MAADLLHQHSDRDRRFSHDDDVYPESQVHRAAESRPRLAWPRPDDHGPRVPTVRARTRRTRRLVRFVNDCDPDRRLGGRTCALHLANVARTASAGKLAGLPALLVHDRQHPGYHQRLRALWHRTDLATLLSNDF